MTVHLIRIGDKVINRERIFQVVTRMLELRARGLSQQEVAEQLEIDRTLISRLETIGEVRKGKKIALVGFPIKNADELKTIAESEGLDFVLLMTEEERLDFARSQNGVDVLNMVMALIARARECDAVIFIGSDQRLKMVEALVGPHVIGLEIGSSPIHDDKYVDPDAIRDLIRNLKES
ncbi:MAG TPA: helix-turn-helix transcriptional regulator [Symbiobacteriaceae bacterium]|nr:helix-turn-helix transcriptional regulator [Symbiobacteriaceae bacterium]